MYVYMFYTVTEGAAGVVFREDNTHNSVTLSGTGLSTARVCVSFGRERLPVLTACNAARLVFEFDDAPTNPFEGPSV